MRLIEDIRFMINHLSADSQRASSFARRKVPGRTRLACW